VSRNLKVTLSYDGSEFHGWQIQPELRTVQGTLAECIARVTGEDILPQGSGRTDAGVHAIGQVVSFCLQSPIPDSNLAIALNDVLPPAVRVKSAKTVDANFHARHSAKAKTYRYRILRSDICRNTLSDDTISPHSQLRIRTAARALPMLRRRGRGRRKPPCRQMSALSILRSGCEPTKS